MIDESEEDPFQEEVVEERQNPQAEALLGIAMSHNHLGLGSEEKDIDQALKLFGLPLPEHIRLRMWDGLRSKDDATWREGYHLLESYIKIHWDEIDEGQVIRQMDKILHSDNIEKFQSDLKAWTGYDSTLDYMGALGGQKAVQKESPPPKAKHPAIKPTKPIPTVAVQWSDVQWPTKRPTYGKPTITQRDVTRWAQENTSHDKSVDVHALYEFLRSKGVDDPDRLMLMYEDLHHTFKDGSSGSSYKKLIAAPFIHHEFVDKLFRISAEYEIFASKSGTLRRALGQIKPEVVRRVLEHNPEYVDMFNKYKAAAKQRKATKQPPNLPPDVPWTNRRTGAKGMGVPLIGKYLGEIYLSRSKDESEAASEPDEAPKHQPAAHENMQDTREKERVAQIKQLSSPQKAVSHAIDYHVPGLLAAYRKNPNKATSSDLDIVFTFLTRPFPAQFASSIEYERVVGNVKKAMKSLDMYYSQHGFHTGANRKVRNHEFEGASSGTSSFAKYILDNVVRNYMPMEQKIRDENTIPSIPVKAAPKIAKKIAPPLQTINYVKADRKTKKLKNNKWWSGHVNPLLKEVSKWVSKNRKEHTEKLATPEGRQQLATMLNKFFSKHRVNPRTFLEPTGPGGILRIGSSTMAVKLAGLFGTTQAKATWKNENEQDLLRRIRELPLKRTGTAKIKLKSALRKRKRSLPETEPSVEIIKKPAPPKKPEPEEDILDLTAQEEEEEIKIGIPEDLEKKDRVVIDEFLKGPGMPHREITGVAKTIENRWKYWAYTIRDMVQLTHLNEEPEMNKIMRAYFSSHVGVSFPGSTQERYQYAARLPELEERLQQIAKGYTPLRKETLPSIPDIPLPGEKPKKKPKQKPKEKPKPSPPPGRFDIPYKYDDLRIRVDAVMETLHDESWLPGALEKDGNRYEFLADTNLKSWWKEQTNLGWRVNLSNFKKWFTHMQQEITPKKIANPREAYDRFTTSLAVQLAYWITAKPAKKPLIQVDRDSLDYWLGYVLNEKGDALRKELEGYYMNPHLHRGKVLSSHRNHVREILASVPQFKKGTKAPAVRFTTEALPYNVGNLSGPWAAGYNQFFGTRLCKQAAITSQRDLMQTEMYKLWIRKLISDGYDRDQIAQIDLSAVMHQHFSNPFGLLPQWDTKHHRRSQTPIYGWYNSISNNRKGKNNALWRTLAKSTDENEKPLTISNFPQRRDAFFKKHPKKRKRKKSITATPSLRKVKWATRERVKVEEKSPDVKLMKVVTDPRGYSGLMLHLREEASKNKNNKFKSVGLVSKFFTLEGKSNILQGLLKRINVMPEREKAAAMWDGVMEDYEFLVKTLGKIPHGTPPRQFVPRSSNMRHQISAHAMSALQNMHKMLVSLMIQRKLGSATRVSKYTAFAEKVYPGLIYSGKAPAAKPPTQWYDPEVMPTLEAGSPQIPAQKPPELETPPRTPPKKRKRSGIDLRKVALTATTIAQAADSPAKSLTASASSVSALSSQFKSAKWRSDLNEEEHGILQRMNTPDREEFAREMDDLPTPERKSKLQRLTQRGRRLSLKLKGIKRSMGEQLGVRLERPGIDTGDISLYESVQVPIQLDLDNIPDLPSFVMSEEKELEEQQQDVTPLRELVREDPDEQDNTPQHILDERGMNLAIFLREQRAQHYEGRRMSMGSNFSRATMRTDRAVIDVPIPGRTIVMLQDIKRRMGKKVDLFDDAQMTGFDRKKWETQLYQKFPIDFSEGFRQHLGSWIKTSYNRKKREFIFVVRRKVTIVQLNSLIAVIESKVPPFHRVTTYIKRKVWEEVYNIHSLYGLHSYVNEELKSVPKVHMKLTW